MPAKLKLDWITERHRDDVAEGRTTVAQIAEEHGATRMAVAKFFGRRGWSGKAVATPSTPPTASATGDTEGPAPSTRAAPALPGPSPSPIACVIDEESAAQIVRPAAVSALMLVIGRATDALSRPLAPQQIRQSAAALETAIGELRRLGIRIDGDHAAGQGEIVIREMTSAEHEETRAAVQAEHEGNFGRSPDQDDADEDEDEDAARAPRSLVGGREEVPASELPPDHSGSPGALVGFPGAHPCGDARPGDLAGRLGLALDHGGRHLLRQVAVICGMEPADDPRATVAALVEAAQDDPDLAARIEVELTRAGL